MAAGKHGVFAVRLVPFGDAGGLVHVLDDLPPADTGVVCTERNLTKLRRVRNDAHLGAAEIVIEQILEPHARDEQEVPAVGAALLNVFDRPIALDPAVPAVLRFRGRAERLVEFLQQIGELEMRRRVERIVVADDGE